MADTIEVKQLLLQIDASEELLRKNIAKAEEVVGDFDAQVERHLSNIEQRFSGLKTGDLTNSIKAVKQEFVKDFTEIQQLAAKAITLPSLSGGGPNIGAAEARAAADAAQQQAAAIALIAEAAERAAAKEGALSRETDIYLRAARAARAEAELTATQLARQAGALETLEIELGQAAGAERVFHAAQSQVVVSAGQQRAGMQQLSYQISDVATSFASGINPMVIFAQQGSQVIQAMTLMKGEATGLLGFLGGPWGAVILGAVSIIGVFGSRLLESRNEAAQAAKGYRDAASAVDQLTQAIARLNSTTKPSLEDLGSLNVKLEEARSKRRQLLADIDSAPGTRAGAQLRYRLKQELDNVETSIDDYEGLLKATKIRLDNYQKLDDLAARDKADKKTQSQQERDARAALRDAERLTASYDKQVQSLQTQLYLDGLRRAGFSELADQEEAILRVREQNLGLDQRRLTNLESMTLEIVKQRQQWERISAPIDIGFDASAALQREFDEKAKLDDELQRRREQQVHSLAGLFQDAMTTGGDAFLRHFEDAGLYAVAQIAARLLTNNGGKGGSFGSIVSDVIGSVFKFADGGRISGPGTSRSDSILAAVSDGEFIVNADATRRNLPLLEAINGGRLPRFADGGLVAESLSAPRISAAALRRGAGGAAPISFDLRGAVMTQDLLNQMQAIAARTGGAAAIGGSSMAQADLARQQRNRLI